MKKMFILMLTVLMALSLVVMVGCQKKEETPATAPEKMEEKAAPAPEAPAPEKMEEKAAPAPEKAAEPAPAPEKKKAAGY